MLMVGFKMSALQCCGIPAEESSRPSARVSMTWEHGISPDGDNREDSDSDSEVAQSCPTLRPHRL